MHFFNHFLDPESLQSILLTYKNGNGINLESVFSALNYV